MKIILSAITAVLGAGVLGALLATQAGAACMDSQLRQGAPTKPSSAMGFVPAMYRPGDATAGSLLPVNDWDRDENAIVGLWQFKLGGFSVDWGTQAWHSDGTEIMFSGGQNPETGDVCQGVWRKVGESVYTLNHIAMGWMAPGGPFGLRVHYHMVVKLNPQANAFSGTYTASVYTESPPPADPFDESPSLLVASGKGTVTATRVNPD
jgi:hypothetical protein